QQDNRRAIQHIVKGADVLGAFCYTGSFEISAAFYGARSVLGLDISQAAIDMCNRNALLNGLENTCRFECVNAFDVLKKWSKDGKQWDVVMLDPPSFTKNRASIDKAVAGYKEINLRGMKLVRPGGFLVTSSCTNLVQPKLFLETIQAAALDAKRRLREVTFNAQSADHPIIPGQENTQYLKFLVVQVI
ncbi:MAG TPA: class I SAM-dependent methyltransferase, partial [Ferruginibacter sp.]|nr:class I SAM-dependent methyltransferase [Ferruginibacter sp.]